MAKHWCSVHGEHRDDDGCPACRAVESRAEEANQELRESLNDVAEQSVRNAVASAEAARHAAYLATNPGDFRCPACMMVSLKRGASRCPMCRSDVPANFWDRVLESERRAEEERKLAEEKRQRWIASPEYAREQEIKRLAARTADRAERAKSLRSGATSFALAVGLFGALYGWIYGTNRFLDVAQKQPYTGLGDGLSNLGGAVVSGLIFGGGGGYIIVAALAWVLASIVVGLINMFRS